VDESLRLGPVAELLAELLGRVVEYLPTDGVLSPEVEQSCKALAFEPGRVVLLENLRFDPGEEANDRAFAMRLADLADDYVDDAFGAVHRAHASVAALPEVLEEQGRTTAAGRLLQREVEALSRLLHEPARPYVAVLGGAKVSDKLGTIGALVERVDALLVGGAMAFTFIAADGGSVGDSLVEPDRFDEVRAARDRADDRGVVLQLPEDVVAAPDRTVEAPRHTVRASEVPTGEMGLDIGPRTVEEFARSIADAKTIMWNGPMGVFELEPFGAGTRGVATAIAGSSAFAVAGGGDSLAAVKKYGLEDGFDHLSTGGGASLEFLEGRELPGIAVLRVAT
jgi:phosphoglycerate kinase